MRRLPLPSNDPSTVFLACVDRVRDHDLRARLQSVQPHIAFVSASYREAADLRQFHTIPSEGNVNGVVTTDEMSDVYKFRMARKHSAGRHIYDSLMAASPLGRCPLCGQGTVSTLDHYLPRTHFPSLAVTPANLIPACKDCNHAKGEIYPLHENEQTLHPYFDDVEDEAWLFAEVIQQSPATLRFYVQPPVLWNPVLANRVTRHFNIFGLAKTYGSYAGEEIAIIRHNLQGIYVTGGANQVRAHLTERFESALAVHINSWHTASYRALAESAWFCDGGFDT